MIRKAVAAAVAAAALVACAGGGADGGSAACDAANQRLEEAQGALAAAQETGDRQALREAIDERAAAAREVEANC